MMKKKDGFDALGFAENLMQNMAPAPLALLRHYRDWGLREIDLICLLRLMRPLLAQGAVGNQEIAAEFAVAVADVAALMQPLVDLGMLTPTADGRGYQGKGLLRNIYEYWLYEQRGSEEEAESKPATAPAASSRFRDLSRLYRRFEAELGRNLRFSENEQIHAWYADDQIPPDLIEEALRRAILRNKTSFAYIDSILRDWQKNGLHDLASIQQLDVKPEPEKKVGKETTRRAARPAGTTRSNQFAALEAEALQPLTAEQE